MVRPILIWIKNTNSMGLLTISRYIVTMLLLVVIYANALLSYGKAL